MAGRLLSLPAAFLPLPLHCCLPLLQGCDVPHNVCGDLPEQASPLAKTHMPVQLPGKCTQAHRERRRKREACSYCWLSMIWLHVHNGSATFLTGGKKCIFWKVNMISSRPNYFKNSMLTVVDGEALKHNHRITLLYLWSPKPGSWKKGQRTLWVRQ